MERKDGLLSEAGEAGPQEVAVSVFRQASLEDPLPLEGGDCPRALVTSNAGGPRTLEATAAADAQGKAPKKVIAQKVSGSVKWYSVKHGYGFLRRHDTQEEVFVHYSAIAPSGLRKHQRSMGTGEAVEFDVLQGERGTEATNVTRPAGAPVKGRRFSSGFYNRPGGPRRLLGARNAKEDVVDGEAIREDFTTTKGQRYCLTSSPRTQRQQRLPPFREAPGATCSPATFASAKGRWAVHLPAPEPPAGPEDTPPRRGHGFSYRLSRPRSRGTAPDPKPSPNLTQELEAEKESRSDADGLQQGSPPRYGCHCPNNPCDCHRPQQLPDGQRQKPEGGEGEIGKGPAGKPACVGEKTRASEGEAAVAKPSSAAQAE